LINTDCLKTDNSVGEAHSFHMYADGSGEGTVGGVTDGTGWMLTIGQHFGVNTAGVLYSNALYASEGVIGPLTLTDKYLQAFCEVKTYIEVNASYEEDQYLFYRYPN
jgi:hypothetical protein